MARFPTKPAHWAIVPGQGYLVNGQVSIVSETERNLGTKEGMTDRERIKCENWSWFEILARLANRYDVSGWGEAPPIPLDELWEMLASANFLIMARGAYGTERTEQLAVPFSWMKWVHVQISRILDSNDEGYNLINFDGTIVAPRMNVSAPAVASFDLTLYPGNDNEIVDGVAIGGSIESFQKLHGTRSTTNSLRSPVYQGY